MSIEDILRIPTYPQGTYLNFWSKVGDAAGEPVGWVSKEECLKIAIKEGATSLTKWARIYKNYRRVPACPHRVYKCLGFFKEVLKGMGGAFVSKWICIRIAAREGATHERMWRKMYKLLKNVPASPPQIYNDREFFAKVRKFKRGKGRYKRRNLSKK